TGGLDSVSMYHCASHRPAALLDSADCARNDAGGPGNAALGLAQTGDGERTHLARAVTLARRRGRSACAAPAQWDNGGRGVGRSLDRPARPAWLLRRPPLDAALGPVLHPPPPRRRLPL